MALTERTEIGSREVLSDGQIQVRVDTIIERDGEYISTSYHRYVIYPGQDYSELEDSVKRICKVEHTPEVIAAFKAAQGA